MAVITKEQRAALLALHGCYEEPEDRPDTRTAYWRIRRIRDDLHVVVWGWTESVEFYIQNLERNIRRAEGGT